MVFGSTTKQLEELKQYYKDRGMSFGREEPRLEKQPGSDPFSPSEQPRLIQSLPEEQPRNRSPSPSPFPARYNNLNTNNTRLAEPVNDEWTEEDAKNWLELSGKKFMRYYYRTQGPNKFKTRKLKETINKINKTKPLGTGSSDCAPMVHPEEIKLTVFEFPDPEDGEYKRGPIRHVQSINPFLTATNMLDALKLAIGGDPKIAAHNAELESVEKEVMRLTKKEKSLTQEIKKIEDQIKTLQTSVSITIPPNFAKAKSDLPLGGGAKTIKTPEELKEQKIQKLEENLNKKREELEATTLALKDAINKLEELQSKDVKGSKAKPTETSATITPSVPVASASNKTSNNKGPPLLGASKPSGLPLTGVGTNVKTPSLKRQERLS